MRKSPTKLNFVLSLTNNENDYQIEQAVAAEEAAKRLGLTLQIIYADNDAITQSQQLLKVIQSESHPDGIILEPVGGTGFPQVARAAAGAEIGWCVLNRDVEYLSELRAAFRVPLFAITSDHEKIGQIQGRQFGAILPQGGSVLYIQGPSESLAAKQRMQGMLTTKPDDVKIPFLMKANWTEEGAYRAVSSWLKLPTSQNAKIDLIGCQADGMAMGARRAFKGLLDNTRREQRLSAPFTGCDGMPKTGQAWVKQGLLRATVIIPANAGKAVDMMALALQTSSEPSERTLTTPISFPSLEALSNDLKKFKTAGR
jgi:ribose transport system substrate-binding protein